MPIKAILMIYAWLPAMILIIMNDDPMLRGFAAGWCFAVGMICGIFMTKQNQGVGDE